MIFVLLALALSLRLFSVNQSLWLDEAINVNVAAGLGYRELITTYSLGDFHPPAYHVLLKTWIDLFGSSEFVARLPSIILGSLTVAVIYLIGKKLFEKKTATIAALLLTTAPLHIYYSQEARMYALAAFLTTLSVYFFVSIIKKDSLYTWIGFIISTALMLYTDYLPYLLIPTYFIYLLINRKNIPQPTFKAFVPAFIIILGLLIPWLTLFPKQLQVGLSAAAASPTWAQVVGSADVKNLALAPVKFTIGRVSVDNNLLYILSFAPLAIFVVFLFTLSLLRMSWARSFILYWFFLPLFLGFIIAHFVPVFAYFRFIFVLPAFYLIWATSINLVNWPPMVRLLVTIALLINLISTSLYLTNPKFQRENWKQATSFIHGNSQPQTLVLFESTSTVAPFDYYNQDKVKAAGALDGFNADASQVENKIKRLTNGKNQIFLFQYLSPITDPQGLVFRELSKQGFNNTGTRDFSGVGFVYEFKR